MSSSTILNDIARDYQSVSSAWFTSLRPIAQAVFWTLVLVELIWSAIWWVVDREDGLGVVAALLRKVLAVGFFYALLLNGGTWIPAIIQGFSQAGASASGVADLSPTGVFDQGLALANQILNAVEGLGLLEGIFPSLVAALTALVVVVAFAIIAAQLLVALVESFIVIGAGILFVGFSGSRWTKFFTERYLSYVASIGVKLFVLYLIMGVGMGIAARWGAVVGRGGFSPIPFFYVMGGSLVFLFLTWHIPSVAGAMMAGAVHLSLADVSYPTMLAGRAGAAGLATAGALFTLGRSHGSVRDGIFRHTGGGGGADGSAGTDGSPARPGGRPRGPFAPPSGGFPPATTSGGAAAPPEAGQPSRALSEQPGERPASPPNPARPRAGES
jgi:type IV secretion system protein TrbL